MATTGRFDLAKRCENSESPANTGLSCAEEDSNLHEEISSQGPQPCASTNSATGAGAGANYSPGAGRTGRNAPFPAGFRHSVRRPVTFTNTRSTNRPDGPSGGFARHGSDKAPAGDLRLHQALGRLARLPADGARHRQGRGPGFVVNGARPFGEPRAAGHDPAR